MFLAYIKSDMNNRIFKQFPQYAQGAENEYVNPDKVYSIFTIFLTSEYQSRRGFIGSDSYGYDNSYGKINNTTVFWYGISSEQQLNLSNYNYCFIGVKFY